LSRFLKSRSGQTAIECALIAVLMVIGIVTGLGAIGEDLSVFFADVSEGFTPEP
jgi:Flp pilus assembly pilin Flp